MASKTTQLPILECSSCLKQVGHLFDDYYSAIITLQDVHDKILYEKENISSAEDPYSLGSIWSDYLAHYYKYMQSVQDSKSPEEYKKIAEMYTFKALICRALLFHRPLTAADLPLHEHQRDSGCVRICCIRALMCDNSTATY